MKHLKHAYLLMVLMAVVCSACRGPEAKENAVANTKQGSAAATTSIFLQSTDGGLTWQDISNGLPVHEQPEGFFAGESEVYVHLKNELYHSKTNLKTPVWDKENFSDLKSRSLKGLPPTLIAFNSSGAIAFNHDGQIYQKTSGAHRDWLPIHTNFKNQGLRTIFETSDGTLFLGYDHGLYKSVDKGENWKQVHKGVVYNVVESAGVLMATNGTSIIRSTDTGENWEGIINEGRVGHFVEPIDGGFIVVSDGSITKPRKIRISLDRGETWKIIDEGLPPSLSISSIKQIGQYLICGHPDGIFRSPDMGKSWTRVYAAPEGFMNAKTFLKVSYGTKRVNTSKKVFTIYSSGNTLYAAVKIPGC